MKVLICGSRTVRQTAKVYSLLDKIHRTERITAVVAGGAVGADTLAARWSRNCDGAPLTLHEHPANWKAHGKAAGPIRNQLMLDLHPDIRQVVAFVDKPLEESRGTADMVRRARAAGIPVTVASVES